MTEKRYYERDYDELYYIIDSHTISEKDFDEQVEYNGYTAFRDSLTGKEIIKLLNENEELKSELNDVGSSFEEQIINLRKENEQLKQEIKEVKSYNNWLVSVLEDTGAIVEIKKGDVE